MIKEFSSALKVKKLRGLIKEWPEVDSNREPSEVWVSIAQGVSLMSKNHYSG